jgi:3-deoxy-D-manno-octulosonic-acid transferase
MKTTGRIALWGYQALTSALLPIFLVRLAWRSRCQPAYRQNWSERLAYYPSGQQVKGACIWIHAVSVGETRACIPLIAALKVLWPDKSILMTHTTPTGRETGENLFGDSVSRCYLPYDVPGALDRFINHFQPEMGLMMETEVWPGVVAACKNKNVPLCLLSGRLSARSAKGYARFGKLVRDAFEGLSLVCSQTEADAQRFRKLGSKHVVVTGNLKFDAPEEPDETSRGQALRAWLGNKRLIFLAASTREGEEPLILAAWKQVKAQESQALLVIVPRHPQRFNEVAQMIGDANLNFARKTEMPQTMIGGKETSLGKSVKVVLGDTMGEMALWYQAADLAYIGGSLLPLGGQNLLEACARACPVIIGPYTFNFTQATKEALASGAAVKVDSPNMLVEIAQDLLNNPIKRSQMGAAGQAFVKRHQGATQRTLEQVKDLLEY